MKKLFALILALTLALSLCACGGQSNSVEKMNMGETASTDIVDFTLDKASLSYYASALATTYAEPLDEPDGGIFAANSGRSLVCLTFTIANNDRGDLNVGAADWKLNFTIQYNGEEYPVKGYDLNEKDGYGSLVFSYAAGAYYNSGSFQKMENRNHIMDAGEVLTVRVVGITGFEPENLDDPFELTVNVPDSSGEMNYFTYSVD